MGRSKEKLQWVVPPKQNRSQERLERILDAAEEIISEKGFEQTSVSEIMTRANLSVGTFYQRFRTKDDLLWWLHERFTEQSIATADQVLDPERWKGASIQTIVESVVPFYVEVYRQRRGLIRAFLIRSSNDVEFNKHAHEKEHHVSDMLKDLLLARKDEFDPPLKGKQIDLAFQMVRSTLNTLALFRTEDRAGFSLDDAPFPKEFAKAFLRCLGIRKVKLVEGEFVMSTASNNRFMAYLIDYASYHKSPANQMTHMVGIPLLAVTILGLFSLIHVGPSFANGWLRLDGGIVLLLGALIWYISMDWKIGVPSSIMGALSYAIGRLIPWPLLIAFFVIGWAIQYVGHLKYEKNKPAFYKNFEHLLIGPVWVFGKVFGFVPPISIEADGPGLAKKAG